MALTLFFYPQRNLKIDVVACWDIVAVYAVGVYAMIYAGVTITKLRKAPRKLRVPGIEEQRIFFFVSAIFFGIIEIPALVFNIIEILNHPEMFHLHVDLFTAAMLIVDILCSMLSTLMLGFSFVQNTVEEEKKKEIEA